MVIVILLILAGVLLLVGELMLPTHGLLGVLGALALVGSVGFAMTMNQWLGVGLLASLMAATPFAWSAAIKIYPKTPIGRKMVLQPVEIKRTPLPVQIGTEGRSLTALRPMGECEFGTTRLEAHSELGMIEAGKVVKVVAIDTGRIIVRAV